MSGTLKVKELIKELLEFDMDDDVFVATGGLTEDGRNAEGACDISHLREFGGYGGIIKTPQGCYIVPLRDLVEARF